MKLRNGILVLAVLVLLLGTGMDLYAQGRGRGGGMGGGRGSGGGSGGGVPDPPDVEEDIPDDVDEEMDHPGQGDDAEEDELDPDDLPEADEEFEFEVVMTPTAIRVHVTDDDGDAVDLRNVRGYLEISFPESRRRAGRVKLKYVRGAERAGTEATVAHLAATGKFRKIRDGEAEVTVVLERLPGEEHRNDRFTVPFEIGALYEWVCPDGHEDDNPAPESGSCRECDRDRERRAYRYQCPEHADAASHDDDKCWICREEMERVDVDE